jgi:hypothetical protein
VGAAASLRDWTILPVALFRCAMPPCGAQLRGAKVRVYEKSFLGILTTINDPSFADIVDLEF